VNHPYPLSNTRTRIAFALAVAAMFGSAPLLHAQEKAAALSFDRTRGFRAELVDLRFVERVEGIERTVFVTEDSIADYRMGIATIRIEKPAGIEMTLPCADITLHYYHGNTPDVSPCSGLSNFSTVLETDRELDVRPANSGPGFLKKTTLERSTEASIVFIDAVFGSMESDTREAWISIAQIDAAAPFLSDGWLAGDVTPCTAVATIRMDSTVSGNWSAECGSTNRSGRYAGYFTFTLPAAATVEVTLESSNDTFLYLLRGAKPTRDVIESDDDGGGGTDSRISTRLEEGDYTIEATTYSEATTGSYTLRLESR
jgi:hypothetical protein